MRLIDADKLVPDAEWNAWESEFTCYSREQIENAPTEEPSLLGYSIDKLLIFAEACRAAHIEDKDLYDFISNAANAYNYASQVVYREITYHIENNISAVTQIPVTLDAISDVEDIDCAWK